MFGRVFRHPEILGWAYRTYRSVGYRYRGRMELTEMSIEVEPNLPKCGGTGMEFVPNETGPSVRRSTETVPKLTQDFDRVGYTY